MQIDEFNNHTLCLQDGYFYLLKGENQPEVEIHTFEIDVAISVDRSIICSMIKEPVLNQCTFQANRNKTV